MKVNTTRNIQNVTDLAIDAQTKRIGKAIAGEPWVELVVPDTGLSDGMLECCLNGYCYLIKVGERVSVPAPVAHLIENAGLIRGPFPLNGGQDSGKGFHAGKK